MPRDPKDEDLKELADAAQVADDEVEIAADDAGASAAMEKLAKVEEKKG